LNEAARAKRSSLEQFQKLDEHNGGPLVGALRERKRLFSRLDDKERQPFYKFYGKDKLEEMMAL